MAYSPTNWQDYPNLSTAITAARLNNMETGISNAVTSGSASIVNADVSPSAAIAYSKLNLANSIVTGDIANGTILDADINAAAAIGIAKLASYPSDATKFLRGDATWAVASPVVATTIAGLGTGTAGAVGILRLGSTPYDFMVLTFDTTYNKWVSPVEYLGTTTGNGGVSSNSTSDVQLGCLLCGVYGPYVTAGLTFQARCVFQMNETGGSSESGTGSMKVGTQAGNAGLATTGGYTAVFGTAAITAQNGVNVFADTGWVSPGSPPTSAAYYTLMATGKTSGTSFAKQWVTQLYTRWVA